MKTKFTLLFLFCITLSFGQTEIENVNVLRNSSSFSTFANYDTSIKGSPFIQKDYQAAKIIKLDKNTFSTMYNAHRDFMEVLKEGGTQYFLPSKKYPYEVVFVNSGVSYKAFYFKGKKENKYGFFKIASKNKTCNLLVREQIKLKEAIKPKTGYGEYTPSKFSREKDTYYINFTKNDIALKLPKKKKAFFKLFSSQSQNIQKFVKKEKLNIKKESDLVKVISYYNTLL